MWLISAALRTFGWFLLVVTVLCIFFVQPSMSDLIYGFVISIGSIAWGREIETDRIVRKDMRAQDRYDRCVNRYR